MSHLTHDEWLHLKHRTRPRQYGLGCGIRDSDWDFADSLSIGSSYTFASSEAPVQLLNNSGGMDDDEDENIKDVWYPHQQLPQTEEADSEMSDTLSSGDDMDMDIDLSNGPTTDVNSIRTTASNQQHLFQPTIAAAYNKRKRGIESIDMNSGMTTAFQMQQQTNFDSTSKRVRVGA